MELTSKQRSHLRGMASTINPIFQIGKASLTPEIQLLPSSGVLIMVLSSARIAGVTAMIKMVTVNSQVTNIRLQ